MHVRNFSLLLIWAILCLHPVGSRAQDIHFSQFWETAVLRNPALLGTSRGDYRALALYRSQWSSISNPFTTALLHAEMRRPIRTSGDNSDYINFGLAAYADKSGSINLRTNGIYPAIAYNKLMNAEKRSYLSAGFTAGYVQRSYDASKMTFSNQWTGTTYDPAAATRENITNPKLSFLDLGAGLSYSSGFGTDNANSYYAGVSAYNITQPRQSFFGTDPSVVRNMRLGVQGGLGLKLGDTYRAELHGNLMRQGTATEVVAGGLLGWQKQAEGWEVVPFSAAVGAFYRFGDALIPTVRITYQAFTFTGSYDVTLSGLRAATAMRGGFEAGLLYSGLFYNEASQRGRTICPTF